jgi:hypothetical protein
MEEEYEIVDFTFDKLNFKNNMKNCRKLLTKTGLVDIYKKKFMKTNTYGFSTTDDVRRFITRHFNADPDTINVFEDNEDNMCILYDRYSMDIKKEIKAMKLFIEKFEINTNVEVYKISEDKSLRDPPFLRFTFHRDYGICVRIPHKDKVISKSKNANKR